MRKWNSKGQHLKSTRLVSCERSRDWMINHKTIKWSIKFKPGLFLLFHLCNTPSPMIRVFLFLVCTLFDNRQQEFCINFVCYYAQSIHMIQCSFCTKINIQYLINPFQSAELDKENVYEDVNEFLFVGLFLRRTVTFCKINNLKVSMKFLCNLTGSRC